MADRKSKKKAPGKAAAATGADRPARPVRPFLTGVGIASGWGAMHMPAVLQTVMLGGFAAKLGAIAIVSGGLIAAAMELLYLFASRLPHLLARLTRQA